MQLMMYIGNDLIETVQLEDTRIPKPGYIGQFKRNLKVKYQDIIRQSSTAPEFLIVNPDPQPRRTNSIAQKPPK